MAQRVTTVLRRFKAGSLHEIASYFTDHTFDDHDENAAEDDCLMKCLLPASLLYEEVADSYPGCGFELLHKSFSLVVWGCVSVHDKMVEQNANTLFLTSIDPVLAASIEHLASLRVFKLYVVHENIC